MVWRVCFFFQAEDGIRDLVRSRGLGDVYKRQVVALAKSKEAVIGGDRRSITFLGSCPELEQDLYSLSLIHI